jgi:hypothetical protein
VNEYSPNSRVRLGHGTLRCAEPVDPLFRAFAGSLDAVWWHSLAPGMCEFRHTDLGMPLHLRRVGRDMGRTPPQHGAASMNARLTVADRWRSSSAMSGPRVMGSSKPHGMLHAFSPCRLRWTSPHVTRAQVEGTVPGLSPAHRPPRSCDSWSERQSESRQYSCPRDSGRNCCRS